MALAHFRMLICELLNNDTDIITEEAPLVVLDSKSYICMAKNGKDTVYTRHISRRMNFVRNEKNARCTRFIGEKEVCSWHKFLPRM